MSCIKDSAGDINQIAETVRLTRSSPQVLRERQDAGGKESERNEAIAETIHLRLRLAALGLCPGYR
jgi:hypothetical protein